MIKVLVVDDDPDVQALLSVWLRGAEFQMIAALDGYQAVQLARTKQPDLIQARHVSWPSLWTRTAS